MAKKKQQSPESSIEELLEGLNLPPSVKFSLATEVLGAYSLRRRFGILSMDIALRGGLPAGTATQLFGQDGIGKDHLINRSIAEVQKVYGEDTKVFLATFGYEMDKTALLMAGCCLPWTEELGKLGIPEDCPVYGAQLKQVGNIIILETPLSIKNAAPAEDVLDTVLRLVASGKFQLGVVNELPAAETRFHVDSSFKDDAKMSALASLMSDFQRKFYPAMRAVKNNESTLIIVNQVRAKIGGMRAKHPTPETTQEQPCGYALRHLKAVDIHLQPAGLVRSGDAIIGKTIRWKIAKGKMGLSEGGSGTYDFIYNKGVDIIKDAVHIGKNCGAIAQAGAWYSIPGFEGKFHGEDNLKEALTQSPEIFDRLYREVYEIHGLGQVQFINE